MSRFAPFTYLATQNAGLYREVMLAFVAAKRRFVVHLRAEDVIAAVGGDPKAVADGLAQLVTWGNLRADPDTGRVTSVEDFHRARFLYQLTPAGEAAERSLAVFDEQLGRRGVLQAVALEDIATGLRALRELARDPRPDTGRTALLLRDIVQRCGDLAENAQAFMGFLQRTIDLYELDTEAFCAYKTQLIDYLERFIKSLTAAGGEIAEILVDLDAADVDRLLTLAAQRDAEDVAPEPGGEQDADAAELESWRERWLGLRQWFVSAQDHPSQAKLLRARARKAIPDLLAVVRLLNERRAGRSDRTADFRELAVWFAEAPDAAAMHQLWQAAFGLQSARHLALDSDTAGAREEQPVAAATPWASAPPLLISPRLRRTGSYERRGKPNRVIDRSEHRRLLAARAAAEADQTARARARLVTGRPIHLSELGELDPDAFGLFLALLGDALAARRAGASDVRTTTGDGSLEIRLAAIPDAVPVQITTATGVLHGLDHMLHIVDLAAPARRLAA
ncbi:MAG: TIGR02677 family protein [Solirubrobacteraceae bacterium]